MQTFNSGVVVRRYEGMPGGSLPPQRPVSLYDNLKNGVNGYGSSYALESSTPTSTSVGNLNSVVHGQSPPPPANLERARTPSQANCLSTTVPQNIAPQGFSSRHAPTRSSLRHSRMIVLTREGRVPMKYQPAVIRKRRLGSALLALLLVLGVMVTAVAAWLLMWAPRLPARDVPSYSGPPLIAAGVTGLILLGCCRKDYPGRPFACCVFCFKVLSVALAILAGLAALCACVFALLHLLSLWGAQCDPSTKEDVTCECRPGPATLLQLGPHEYPDLNCPEVTAILAMILTGSCAANGLAGMLAAWYVFLHWSSRYTNVYSKVRTTEANPMVISNKT